MGFVFLELLRSLECDPHSTIPLFIFILGCPGCIQAVPCINFQQDLSRSAGLLVARRMLARIQQTPLYQENCETMEKNNTDGQKNSNIDANIVLPSSHSSPSASTPRGKLRQKKLERAADLVSARKRNIVVGRESWPADHASARFNSTVEDIEAATTSNAASYYPSQDGGFM